MVQVRHVLRDHDGDVGLARDGRGVRVVEHEADVLFQETQLDDVLQVGGVHLDLGVQAGAPVRCIFRIIPLPRLVQLAEDGFDVTVVRLHQGGVQLVDIQLQTEIHLREGTVHDGKRLAFIADEGGRKDFCILGTGLQAVAAVQVCGDADGGAVEIDAHEGEGLTGVCVRHTPADTRRLGCSCKSHKPEQDCDE